MMSATTITSAAVTVGASAVLVSAYAANKRWAMIQAAAANTLLIYLDGDTGVATADGFGELAAGQVVTIPGAAAIYAISSGASQAVRVLTGLA